MEFKLCEHSIVGVYKTVIITKKCYVFFCVTAQGKSFKFHNPCNYNIKIFAVAMGNIFSMYQPSEQELKRQVKDLVVALQLEGQHKIENLLYS